MNNVELILSQIGFSAEKFTPYNINAIKELFVTLKFYISEKYDIQDELLESVNFEFISGINTFAERVKIKNESTIIIGENFDVLLDLYERKDSFSDEHFTLLQYNILSKLATQKLLKKSKIKEALWMYNFNGEVFESYIELNEEVEEPTLKEYKILQTNKMKSYIFLLGHEFGHILYKMGKLNAEKKILDQYINRSLLLKNEILLKNLFLWDSYFESFNDIANKNTNLDNLVPKINVDDYNYLTDEGISKLLSFYNMIKEDSSMKEEIVCDIFAINFFIVSFGVDDGLNFIKSLNTIQSSLTLLYHLFESEKQLTNKLFYKSFARYIINPELLSSLFKLKPDDIFNISDFKNDFFESTLSVFMHFKNSIIDYEFDVPDFFNKNEEYNSLIKELTEFSKIP